jgi:hypothetical protein
MRLSVVLNIVAGLVFAGPVAARPLVVFIGESTTWGVSSRPVTHWKFGRTIIPPQQHLAALLGRAPRDCPWRKARVLNYALPETVTGIWSRGEPGVYCSLLGRGFNPALDVACARKVPVGMVLNEVIAKRHGRRPDLFLLTMGTNDSTLPGVTPELTVDNIEALVNLLTPVRVLVSPPLPRTFPPPPDWPDRVRAVELARGLVTGPDFHRYPLPLYEGFHETDGGYAAFAGYWFDALCPTPF